MKERLRNKESGRCYHDPAQWAFTPRNISNLWVLQETAKLGRQNEVEGEEPNTLPCQPTEREIPACGALPQLLNPLDEAEAQRLLHDPNWCMQEKLDGKRLLLQKRGEQLTAINRNGMAIGLLSSIGVSALKIPGDFILDGEWLGETLYAFDLLECNGEDCRSHSYQRRLASLSSLLSRSSVDHIQLIETAFEAQHKEQLLRRLQAENKEGVVFKHLGAPYTPGRPECGGPQLERTFSATCSALVAQVYEDRSVALWLRHGQGWVSCGKVAVPLSLNLPQAGEVVEICYLYAHPHTNALAQPVYLGVCKDIEPQACVLSQLKYKAG